MSYGGGGATDSSLVKLCVGFITSLPQDSGGVMSSAVQRWWDGGAAVQRWWGDAS
ncbi:hypothetical protein F2Q70_00003184 [Brassica cretica]|uniref:Uncharacterized protein n=1 Tax=Brassica cretica TaxID=69181 RepID=A0A8S9IR08_BRACR|nr:hypothetical protein F2Q68_00020789 [Brassica cretica]KAF2571177.1 hypothetical protein F2Q70_00003184 [Brassica cretica]